MKYTVVASYVDGTVKRVHTASTEKRAHDWNAAWSEGLIRRASAAVSQVLRQGKPGNAANTDYVPVKTEIIPMDANGHCGRCTGYKHVPEKCPKHTP